MKKRMLFFSPFGGGGGSPPAPPPFKKVKIPETADLAYKYQQLAYEMSDQDLAARFPGLVAQRDANTKQALADLTGPLNPTLQNQFAKTSLSNALTAFGPSSMDTGIGETGSAARGAVTSGIVGQTQNFRDIARQNLETQLQDQPPRDAGFSGEDALNLLIGNVVGQNQRNYAAYSGQVQGANAASAAGASQAQSTIGTVISIIGIVL